MCLILNLLSSPNICTSSSVFSVHNFFLSCIPSHLVSHIILGICEGVHLSSFIHHYSNSKHCLRISITGHFQWSLCQSSLGPPIHLVHSAIRVIFLNWTCLTPSCLNPFIIFLFWRQIQKLWKWFTSPFALWLCMLLTFITYFSSLAIYTPIIVMPNLYQFLIRPG